VKKNQIARERGQKEQKAFMTQSQNFAIERRFDHDYNYALTMMPHKGKR